MMIQAGKLESRIRIEKFVEVRDPDYNSVKKQWMPFATVWAQLLDVLPSKSESVQSTVEIAERPARVRMHYLAGITPDMRVVVLLANGEPERICEIVAGPAYLGAREGTELLVKDFGRQVTP